MEIELPRNEENYIKSIEPFRRIALSLAPLSVSLASVSLAFEIYYLREIYDPKTSGIQSDLITILPVLAGGFLLIVAAFCIDWVLDSLSPQEMRALNVMHQSVDKSDHKEFTGEKNEIHFRRRLFSGGYMIFCFCIGIAMFLLTASIPIFIKNEYISGSNIIRYICTVFAFFYAAIVVAKMLTKRISDGHWTTIIVIGAGTVLVNVVLTYFYLLN
ncbi:small-conductance mechanosensitive channel [Azospirillum fermentarium]|uniref:hypothetical protein n=1 Tax=Azospirillum fermentarium TaxID=1233114 RepID=UPI0022271DEF|nr:hypothetical protein [Azospirillum fermentarium]MCW2245676.1 small-conductance mechanosensitive channel [Azospirillum fermentarium]